VKPPANVISLAHFDSHFGFMQISCEIFNSKIELCNLLILKHKQILYEYYCRVDMELWFFEFWDSLKSLYVYKVYICTTICFVRLWK